MAAFCRVSFTQNLFAWSQCSAGHYNSTELGVISCTYEKFDDDLFTTAPEYAGNYMQFAEFHSDNLVESAGSSACLMCPANCLNCLNEVPVVKAGFALSDARRTTSDHATACEINLPGGKSVAAKCVSLLRCRPDVVQVDGANYQCNGGELTGDAHIAMSCAEGYEGQLCGTCSEDFGREEGNVCVSCSEATSPKKIFTWALIFGLLAFIVGWVVIHLRHQLPDRQTAPKDTDKGSRQVVSSNPLLIMEDNLNVMNSSMDDGELNGHGHSHGNPGDGSKTKIQVAGSMIRSLIFVGIQPVKICITYFQIASLLGAV